MATIYIKDLIIEAKHGVNEREKQAAQRFQVTVELSVDTTKAGISDNLADTIDWSSLRHSLITTVQNNSFNLMERLAREIADQILIDRRIEKVVVSIDKLDAFKTGVPGIRLQVVR